MIKEQSQEKQEREVNERIMKREENGNNPR